MTSSKMTATWGAILDFTKNYKLPKNVKKLELFDAGHVEYDIIKHFAAFLVIFFGIFA